MTKRLREAKCVMFSFDACSRGAGWNGTLFVGFSIFYLVVGIREICPEVHVNEIHLPHNRHNKVSSLMKFHLNTKLYQI